MLHLLNLFIIALTLQTTGGIPLGFTDTVGKELGSFQTRHLVQSLEEQKIIDQQNAADYCARGNFSALYETIKQDLVPWKKTGITTKLMDWVLKDVYNIPVRHKGAGILFRGGKPYIITDPALLKDVGHHRKLIAAHFALFQALSDTFGTAIPDVEFLFTSADEPSSLLAHHHGGFNPERLPLVLSFCKSASYADVLIPDIHFFMRNFTTNLLEAAGNFTATWPWERKTPRLFGRFSPYARIVSKHAPELYRQGKRGKNICSDASDDQWFCNVRKHYIWEWANKANFSGLPLDVAQQPKRDMMHHASFKWVLHLDGQTCSSRLEQLMVLGSLVMKEESGYRAFFHHLIKPYEHYVPIWKRVPEDTKEAIAWAQENDGEAASIAAAAQQVALRYLHKRAIMCYWLRVMQDMSRMLTYRPGPEAGDRQYPFLTPLEDYMKAEGHKELVKLRLTNMEFWN